MKLVGKRKKNWRNVAKMTNMFKNNTGEVPEYFLILSQRNVIKHFHTTLVTKKIILFLDADYNNQKSFIPDAVKQWKILKVEVMKPSQSNHFGKTWKQSVSTIILFFRQAIYQYHSDKAETLLYTNL